MAFVRSSGLSFDRLNTVVLRSERSAPKAIPSEAKKNMLIAKRISEFVPEGIAFGTESGWVEAMQKRRHWNMRRWQHSIRTWKQRQVFRSSSFFYMNFQIPNRSFRYTNVKVKTITLGNLSNKSRKFIFIWEFDFEENINFYLLIYLKYFFGNRKLYYTLFFIFVKNSIIIIKIFHLKL